MTHGNTGQECFLVSKVFAKECLVGKAMSNHKIKDA